MDLISKLKSYNIIKTGNFLLKSGGYSSVYFDFKSLVSYPRMISDISYELSKLIESSSSIGARNICIAGVPLGGLIYALAVSQIKDMPMLLIRQEQKTYGMCQQIEGGSDEKELVLIEDVITTGTSVINTLKLLSEKKINSIICILDRESGGTEKLRELGHKVISLFTMSDIVNHKTQIPNTLAITNTTTQTLINIINTKKTNLVAALDFDDKDGLLNAVNLIGDYVCAVKIHYDILDSITPTFITRLQQLKQEKKFLVIEDRKLADIPYIAEKQLNSVRRFADIVTVHGICGENLVKKINSLDIGILLVHQLSVENNLIDCTYSNRVRDMAHKFNNVVGFVSQEKVSNYLTFTPGVGITTTTDGMGQSYKPIKNCDSDVFIIGRSLYESNDIVAITQFFTKMCFGKWKYAV